MAVWDKYEGRSPFLISHESDELYDLKPDDRLFKDDPNSGVWINIDSPLDRYRDERPEWFAYVWGFKEAADRLVEDLVREGDSSMHTRFLGNPILALYRHSVELAIKSILITGGATREPATLKSHNLSWLWEQAINAMEREKSNTSDGDSLTMVGKLIAELNEADTNSENFRYGVDKKLKPYGRQVEQMDVVNLRSVMFKLAVALDGCDTWLYEMQQARWEYEAEMRQEFYNEMREYYGEPGDF